MFAATGSWCPSSHPCAAQGHRAHSPPPGKRPLLSEGRRGITPVPRSNAFPRRVLLPPQSARACGHPSPAPKLHHRVVPGAGSSGRYQRRGRAAAQLTLHGALPCPAPRRPRRHRPVTRGHQQPGQPRSAPRAEPAGGDGERDGSAGPRGGSAALRHPLRGTRGTPHPALVCLVFLKK